MLVTIAHAEHDVRHHVEKLWVVVDRLRPDHRQPDFVADATGFDVKVVEHFHVVADEANRTEDRRLAAARARLAKVVADVGAEPWIVRAPAATLIDGGIAPPWPCAFGHQPCGFLELRAVGISGGHRFGNAVRREHEFRAVAKRRLDPGECRPHALSVGVDKERVVVPIGYVSDLDIRQSGTRQRGARLLDVFAVLRAARIAAVRGGDEAHRPADAGSRHLRERIGEVRMPVAHPDEDGKGCSGRDQAMGKALGLSGGQLREGRAAAHDVVVVRHFLDASRGDPPPAQHVLEKRTNVRLSLRTAEGDHQHGIEGLGHVSPPIILIAPVALASSTLGLPRPVWLLGWVSLVTDMASEMIYPLLPVFLTRVLGASAMSLGIIEGVAEAANSVLKIAAGRLADRTGAPKRIVLAGYGISGAVRPLVALVSSWTHVLALRFVDRLGKGIRGAPRDAMLGHFAPPHLRGRAYGFHRAMDHAGAVVGPLIASLFLFVYPDAYRSLFALSIIPGIVVILILLRVPDTTKAPLEPLEPAEPREPLEPRLSAPFWKAIAVILVFSLGNASDAFLLLRLNDLGVATFWIPLLWSGLHVVKVLSSVAGGDLSDRFGRRTLIAAGWIVYALVYAAFGYFESAAPVIVIFLCYGLYFGLTEGVEKAWVADLAPAGARGTAFGVYNAALGVGGLASSLMFGVIWTRVSPQAAFLTGGAVALLAIGLLYCLFSLQTNEENPRHQR